MSDGVRDAALRDVEGCHDDAVALLRKASAAGDIAATRVLGKRLTVGRDAPFLPQEGVALLTAAMDKGDAEATAVMAALTGAGAWTTQSWPRALDLLQHAAERGSGDARAQLALLAPPELAASTDWKRLRDAIRLESWVVPPVPRQTSETPRVWSVENFASADICTWLIGRAQGRMTRAKVFDGKTVSIDGKRSNSSFGIDIVEAGIVTQLLRFRIMGATTLSVTNMEPPHILHYAEGEEFAPHYDALYINAPDGGDSERQVTFLLYLHDGYEGGELEFTRTGFRHKGAMGDGVFFTNMAGGKPDPLSEHAGLPVTRGEKWLLSQWIRDRPSGAAQQG